MADGSVVNIIAEAVARLKNEHCGGCKVGQALRVLEEACACEAKSTPVREDCNSVGAAPKAMKRCAKCKKDVSVELFGKNKQAKDGLNYWCKPCTHTYQNSFDRVRNKNRRKGISLREEKPDVGNPGTDGLELESIRDKPEDANPEKLRGGKYRCNLCKSECSDWDRYTVHMLRIHNVRV